MRIRSYRDPIVWRKGTELATEVYRISRKFPNWERFGLVGQIQRAAVSVPSNIAEGQARQHRAEFRHFLHQALGSLAEVDIQLYLAQELRYLEPADAARAVSLIGELQRMLHTLVARLPPAKPGSK